MQNSFKFRVWLEEENKMISPEDENADCIFAYNQHGNLLKFVGNNEVIWARIGHTIYDKHVMQCTGLKDKNDKLIYIGDVVKDDATNAIYKVSKKSCAIYLENDKYIGYFHELSIAYAEKRLEVIGNIYENPELLGDIDEILYK